MHPETKTAVLAGNGGLVVSKAVVAKTYQNTTLTATDLAVSNIARRFHLSIATARLVCELAGIGGLRA